MPRPRINPDMPRHAGPRVQFYMTTEQRKWMSEHITYNKARKKGPQTVQALMELMYQIYQESV